MAPLALLSVVSASILSLVRASEDDVTITYTAKLGEEGACLTDINAARAKVGFSELTKPTTGETDKKLPEGPAAETAATGDWLSLCKALIPEEILEKALGSDVETPKFGSGTYAFKTLTSETPNCADIVDGWNAAYKNFSDLPPPNDNSTTIYDDRDNVSFVAIYNPSPAATADCRVVTCAQKTTTAGGEQRMRSTGDGQSKLGYALVCMTTPDVLTAGENAAPFTEEQWGKIVSAFTGSASTVLPSLFGLTATAVAIGVTLL
ncbi:SAG family member [Eimeria mitis]|uniref:SAG family member n=1 Tax=Eimeria mitis TaxID=44415 RepID=U6JQK6_9EIME|nr:SAG family member [Eimeria mitis]CDJ27734.1 SAG family member [Eimeria mitis]